MTAVLLLSGFAAGCIDAIAGGGGLITLPVLLWALGSGAEAVGTNKIVGVSAALAALWVYRRAGHLVLGESIRFSIVVGIGAVGGSFVSPLLPPSAFRWFVLIVSPCIFWLLGRREVWEKANTNRAPLSATQVLLWGILAGFYDGMWGPGGGTFLFMVLFLGAKLPLMQALASSKLANTFTAGFSLLSFSARGYVHWPEGLLMASSVVVGALVGAYFANRAAARIVRPVLGIVTVLLILKVFL